MKKKFFVLVFAFTFVLALTGCGGDEKVSFIEIKDINTLDEKVQFQVAVATAGLSQSDGYFVYDSSIIKELKNDILLLSPGEGVKERFIVDRIEKSGKEIKVTVKKVAIDPNSTNLFEIGAVYLAEVNSDLSGKLTVVQSDGTVLKEIVEKTRM